MEEIAADCWRLRRLYRTEAGLIADRQRRVAEKRKRRDWEREMRRERHEFDGDPLEERLSGLKWALSRPKHLRKRVCEKDPSLADASEEEIRAAAEEEMAALRRKRAERVACEEDLYRAESSMPDIYEALELSRYETALRNRVDRAILQLEHLQASRGAKLLAQDMSQEED